MILELNDEEILDLLMTSEFENNLSPAEFKYLLKKWRYFYRYQSGMFDRTKDDLTYSIKTLNDELEAIKKQNYDLMVESAQKDDKILNLKNRKLTFKERWHGKIIDRKDEDK